MNIAIAGYGLEGEQNYIYYSRDKSNNITIVDEKSSPDRELPGGVPTILGEGSFSKLQGFDMVIRTASLNPGKIRTNGKIWSSTAEFFEKCPAKIIGVTGTKGKGTVSSMITSMLQETGKKVWLVGNIGTPALSVLGDVSADDIVVYELSSFQLWDLEASPSVAVITMIEQDHLDIHLDFDDYLVAKSNIVRYQSKEDTVIYDIGNRYARSIAYMAPGEKLGHQDESTVRVKDDCFYISDTKLFSIDKLQLVGEHNINNTCAAILAVWMFTQDIEAIGRGLSKFKGLEHRLMLIGNIDGVDYYDDSISTTPGSAIAALKSFEGHKIIIMGGSSKGSDFDELAKFISTQDVFVILIGQESERIATSFEKVRFTGFEILKTKNMVEVVEEAQKNANSGDTVLLSPAAASFGMFDNYVDRGNQFIAAVKNIKRDEA